MSETIESTGPVEPPSPEPPPPAEPPEQEPKPEAEPAKPEDKEEAGNKRFGRLTARFNAQTRELEEMRARMAALEAERAQQLGPQPEQQVQAEIMRQAKLLAEQQAAQARKDAFHQAGSDAYGAQEWKDRCQKIVAMGADAELAQLLIEMPNGAKIVGALSDDLSELERIAAIRGERGRAIALGQYAERMTGKPAKQVSQAPRPIKPIEAGHVDDKVDLYKQPIDKLVDIFAKEVIDNQKKQGRR